MSGGYRRFEVTGASRTGFQAYVGQAPSVRIKGQIITAGTTSYINMLDAVALSTTDPVSNGVASGINKTACFIDISPASCGDLGAIIPNTRFGSCDNYLYTGLFTLSPGTHTISYLSVDNVGNIEPAKNIQIINIGYSADTLPPVTNVFINGVIASSDNAGFIRVGSTITLVAEDPSQNGAGSEVDYTSYHVNKYVDGNWVQVATGRYSAPIVVWMEGAYDLYYQSIDKAGNQEVLKHLISNIDGTPPVTTVMVNGQSVGAIADITPTAGITLTAVDPVSNEVASGENGIDCYIDISPTSCGDLGNVSTAAFGSCQNSRYTTPFMLAVGTHTIYFTAQDKIGNQEGMKSVSFTVLKDTTSPVTAIGFEGPSFGAEPVYVSSRTKIVMQAMDDLSSVAAKYCAIDSAPFMVCPDSFSIMADGAHIVRYYSVDASSNTETVNVSSVTVDNRAPMVQVDIAGVVYGSGVVSYIPAASVVTLRASDQASGLKELYYALNGSTYSIAAGSITLELAEGVNALVYNAADNLGNTAGPQTRSIAMDKTAPLSVFEVAGSSQVIDGNLYVLNGSSVVLSVSDALSGVMGIGCFIDISPVSCGNLGAIVSTAPFGSCQNYQYVNPFALAVGTHTIFYASRDNVGNLEGIKYVNFAVTEGSPSLDITPPVTTATIAGVFGQNNWYVSLVAVTLGSTDDISGVKETFYRLDGSTAVVYGLPFPVTAEGKHVLTAYSTDNSGNTESPRTFNFKIDVSTPVVEYSLTPAPAPSGWYNTPAAVVFTGTDAVSGIAYCSSSMSVTTAGYNPVTGSCTDNAGLSSSVMFTVKIDTTAPVSTATLAGEYKDGYYESQVVVSITPTDTLSGVMGTGCFIDISPESCGNLGPNDPSKPFGSCQNYLYTGPFTLGVGTHTVSYSSRDNAGNREAIRSVSFIVREVASGLDIVPPVTTATIAGMAGQNGWYVSPVAVTLVSTDALSGVKQTFYSLDGSNALVYGLPFLVTVGGKHVLSVYSTDNADNTESPGTFRFKIDVSLPVSTVTFAGAYNNGAYTGPVEVTIVSTDALSGVAATYYSLDGGTTTLYTGTFTAQAGGQHNLMFYGLDNAGNVEAQQTAAFNIAAQPDTTPPAVKAWADGMEVMDGGSIIISTSTAVSLTAIDLPADGSASGVRAVYYSVDVALSSQTAGRYTMPFILPEGMHIVYYAGVDMAGNMAAVRTAVLDVRGGGQAMDTTPPMVSAWANGMEIMDGGSMAVSTDTAISLNPADPVVNGTASGVRDVYYVVDTAFSTQAALTSPLVFTLPVGTHTVRYTAVDMAGNMAALKTAVFIVSANGGGQGPDTVPPAVTAWLNGGEVPDGGSVSASTDNIITLNASDLPADGTDSGLKAIYYTVDMAFSTKTASYSPSFSVSFTLGVGTHTVYYTAADLAGNRALLRMAVISVNSGTPLPDTTPPFVYARVGAGVLPDGSSTTITVSDMITLEAMDTAGGAASSGLEGIYYTVDEPFIMPAVQYTVPFALPLGAHVVYYTAFDMAGNQAAVKIASVTVFTELADTTPPQTRPYLDGVPVSSGGAPLYLRPGAELTFAASDPLVGYYTSGLAFTTYTITQFISSDWVTIAGGTYFEPIIPRQEGYYTLYFHSKDNAGNWEAQKARQCYVDGTPPQTLAYIDGVPVLAGTTEYVRLGAALTLVSNDPPGGDYASGVALTTYIKTRYVPPDEVITDSGTYSGPLFALHEGYSAVYFQSRDNAGNLEAQKSVMGYIDGTAPVVGASVNGAAVANGATADITNLDPVVLTAADPESGGVSAGLKDILYTLDAPFSTQTATAYTQAFTLERGVHTIRYTAADNVGNQAEIRTAVFSVKIDTLAPVTTAFIDGTQYKAFGLTVISTAARVALTAFDPEGGEWVSGVVSTTYEVTDLRTSGTTAPTVYTSSFTLGQGTYLIRYRSADRAGNLEAYKELRVAVTPWPTAALAAAGTITTTGKAAVTGPSLSGPAAGTPLYLPDLLSSAVQTNNNAAIAQYLIGGALTLSNKTTVTLSSGVYYLKGIELSGTAKVLVSGRAELVVDGPVVITVGAVLNSDIPELLSLYVSTAGRIELGGSGALNGYVYAPGAALTMGANSVLSGHSFVKSAVLGGNAKVKISTATTGGQAHVTEAGFVSLFVPPTFTAGEAYAYPNPAKGNSVVFHFECGQADSAHVTVFDISGHKMHEADMGAPLVIGGKYAYRNTWNIGSAASGVYIYVLRAQKTGYSAIVKKNKVAVVR